MALAKEALAAVWDRYSWMMEVWSVVSCGVGVY